MNFFQKLFQSPSAMLKLSIALCYIALGVYLYLNSILLSFIDKPYRVIMTVVFIAYGVFRLYRVINDVRND